MPKRASQLSHIKKKKTKAEIQPETENEFLEAADEFEQQGGKHRAGDAGKSSRAFQRAFDVYDAGLTRFPQSFDLTYNKAVLQFELAQDPRICPHFGPRHLFLEAALETHRQARRLNEEDANTLFNTAQVLTSLAEILVDSRDADERSRAAPLLEEAVELLSACFSRQEAEYSEMVAAVKNSDQEGGVSLAQDSSSTISTPSMVHEESEQYATVVEPVTPETLLDTLFAQLSALASLASAYVHSLPHANPLTSIQVIANPILEQKILLYISQLPELLPEEPKKIATPTLTLSLSGAIEKPSEMPIAATQKTKTAEANLLRANFSAAMVDTEFRFQLVDIQTYSSRLSSAFRAVISAKPSGLFEQTQLREAYEAYAEALIAFANTTGEVAGRSAGFETDGLRLDALDEALKRLDMVCQQDTTTMSPKRCAELAALRGDILLQSRTIVLQPHAPKDMQTRAPGMLDAAEKQYSTAVDGLITLKMDETEKVTWSTSNVKLLVVTALQGKTSSKSLQERLSLVKETMLRDVIRDMLEEELITLQEAELVGSLLK